MKNFRIIILTLFLIVIIATFIGCDGILDPTELLFKQNEVTLNVGDEINLFEMIDAKGIELSKVKFNSSNEEVVSITDGILTAKSAGVSFVTGKSGFKSAICKITVEGNQETHNCLSQCPICQKCTNVNCVEPICENKCGGHSSLPPDNVEVESVMLKDKQLTVVLGTQRILDYTVLPENATDKTVEWSSDNNDVVIVDNNGVMNAKKTGKATITVRTSNGKKDTCIVTVDYAPKMTEEEWKSALLAIYLSEDNYTVELYSAVDSLSGKIMFGNNKKYSLESQDGVNKEQYSELIGDTVYEYNFENGKWIKTESDYNKLVPLGDFGSIFKGEENSYSDYDYVDGSYVKFRSDGIVITLTFTESGVRARYYDEQNGIARQDIRYYFYDFGSTEVILPQVDLPSIDLPQLPIAIDLMDRPISKDEWDAAFKATLSCLENHTLEEWIFDSGEMQDHDFVYRQDGKIKVIYSSSTTPASESYFSIDGNGVVYHYYERNGEYKKYYDGKPDTTKSQYNMPFNSMERALGDWENGLTWNYEDFIYIDGRYVFKNVQDIYSMVVIRDGKVTATIGVLTQYNCIDMFLLSDLGSTVVDLPDVDFRDMPSDVVSKPTEIPEMSKQLSEQEWFDAFENLSNYTVELVTFESDNVTYKIDGKYTQVIDSLSDGDSYWQAIINDVTCLKINCVNGEYNVSNYISDATGLINLIQLLRYGFNAFKFADGKYVTTGINTMCSRDVSLVELTFDGDRISTISAYCEYTKTWAVYRFTDVGNTLLEIPKEVQNIINGYQN